MRARIGLLVVALLPAAAGATSLDTREVRVTDTTLRPVEASIALDDAVRWRNAGTKAHTVASDTRAWTPFTLRPGRAKTVRFERAGCYRYKVDGRLRGRVAVSAACGGGGAPPPPTTGTTTFRYDVTVTGRAHTVQRHSGDAPGIYNRNGTVDVELAWESTFRNVKLKKVAVGGDTFVIANAGGLFGRGTTQVKFSYKHARPELSGICDGSFSLALPSRVRVGGSRSTGSIGADFTLGSQLLLPASKTLFDRVMGAQTADCRDYSDEPRWFEIGGSPKPDIVRGGLTWQDVAPITSLSVSVDRRRARRMFFPLDRLESGEGFLIQTGPVRNEEPCHFGVLARVCTETFTGFLRVKLVPRRP